MNSIFIILYIESEEYYISFPKNESHSKNRFLQLEIKCAQLNYYENLECPLKIPNMVISHLWCTKSLFIFSI